MGTGAANFGGLPQVGDVRNAAAMPLPAPPGLAAIAQDNVATLLQALAEPYIAELLFKMDSRPAPAAAAALLQEARAAVAAGDTQSALAKIQELVRISPGHSETVDSDPALEAVRSEVVNLLQRMAAGARGEAEDKIASAWRAVEGAGSAGPDAIKQDVALFDPRVVLAVAAHFVEAGRLLDCARASELAGTVLERYQWAPFAPDPVPGSREHAAESRRSLVRRLLWMWCAAGAVTAGVGTLWRELWDASVAVAVAVIWVVVFGALLGVSLRVITGSRAGGAE